MFWVWLMEEEEEEGRMEEGPAIVEARSDPSIALGWTLLVTTESSILLSS